MVSNLVPVWGPVVQRVSGINFNNLVQTFALVLKFSLLMESEGSPGGCPPSSSIEIAHGVLLLLSQLIKVSLHGNVMGPKMLCPGCGGARLAHPTFCKFSLSPISIHH